MIRTTITLPEDLYEELRTAAFYQKKTISELIRYKLRRSPKKKILKPGENIKRILGKYTVKNFKEVSRDDVYNPFH